MATSKLRVVSPAVGDQVASVCRLPPRAKVGPKSKDAAIPPTELTGKYHALVVPDSTNHRRRWCAMTFDHFEMFGEPVVETSPGLVGDAVVAQVVHDVPLKWRGASTPFVMTRNYPPFVEKVVCSQRAFASPDTTAAPTAPGDVTL